nr:hypothetical protein [Tanacetum cinerariifolium]
MLRLRDKIRKHVLWKIRDGKTVNAWYDNWSPRGPLCDTITTTEIYDACMNIDTTVAELVNIGNGNWPDGWVNEYPILNQYKFLCLQKGMKDDIVWVDNAERMFGVKYVWKDLCYDASNVEWHKIVWFSKCIPGHAFVVWMAIQNILSTQDRIAIWKPTMHKYSR